MGLGGVSCLEGSLGAFSLWEVRSVDRKVPLGGKSPYSVLWKANPQEFYDRMSPVTLPKLSE
jgi:hypothetical protein